MMARVSDNIRRRLLDLSRNNRTFMDDLQQLIWCECREGNTTKSTSWEDWCDIWLSTARLEGASCDWDGKPYLTPRNAMTKEQLEAVQGFIDTHTFHDGIQARREIADDLLNHCCSCLLTCRPRPWETFEDTTPMETRETGDVQLGLFDGLNL
ncbi:MAG: hypothetical protein LUD72_01095 [Bacteroidales bacterium]|nr:hypothetical protein [Bacteroidales bacterium]